LPDLIFFEILFTEGFAALGPLQHRELCNIHLTSLNSSENDLEKKTFIHHLLIFDLKHSCESRKTPKQKLVLTVLEIL
jgi:hypothetical protein